MKEESSKRSVGVGIFIIVGILFLLGGILTIGNLHSTFSKKLTISTVFGGVNGLIAGNNIWFSGVKIGTVKKLEFYGQSQVKVIMNINVESRKFIRKDAKVKLGSDGFIGNKILIIYGGEMNSPEVEEGDELSNETLLTTEEIMETFQENNLNVLKFTQTLANSHGTLYRLLLEDSIYTSIEAASLSMKTAAENANNLMKSLAAFANKLDDKGTVVNELVTDTLVFLALRSTVLKLRDMADSSSVFVSNLRKASQDPNSPVGVLIHDEQSGHALKGAIENLEKSSFKLDQNMEALQRSFLLRKYFRDGQLKEKK